MAQDEDALWTDFGDIRWKQVRHEHSQTDDGDCWYEGGILPAVGLREQCQVMGLRGRGVRIL
jgi:hypothetical protein